MNVLAHTYVFSVPNSEWVKVGATANLSRRLYQLRWGNMPLYVPQNVHEGQYSCVIGSESLATAKLIEKNIQSRLHEFRLDNRRGGEKFWGGKPEWFKIHTNCAVSAAISVAKQSGNAIVINNFIGMPLFDLT